MDLYRKRGSCLGRKLTTKTGTEPKYTHILGQGFQGCEKGMHFPLILLNTEPKLTKETMVQSDFRQVMPSDVLQRLGVGSLKVMFHKFLKLRQIKSDQSI